MNDLILYSFRRCPFAMRARMTFLVMEIKYEIREIHLREKPDEMIKLSSKGTVPVLFDPIKNIVIDESVEIMKVFLAKSKNKKFQFNAYNLEFIKFFDNIFKYHLDRYKYANRYENGNTQKLFHRDQCVKFLEKNFSKIIQEEINDNIEFKNHLSFNLIATLPFIRQFRIANEKWFDEYYENNLISKVLNYFIESKSFKEIMSKFPKWVKDSKPTFIN
jgi:glutaredoxin 2